MRVRFEVWEQGNISPLQLTDRLRAALRHALCDVLMEMRVLPSPLCLDTFCLPVAAQRDESTGEQLMHNMMHYMNYCYDAFWRLTAPGHYIIVLCFNMLSVFQWKKMGL